MTRTLKALGVIALAFALGCNRTDETVPMGHGQLAIKATASSRASAPRSGLTGANGVREIHVSIVKITAHVSGGGWVTVSDAPISLDLLNLGSLATLLGQVTLPAGTVTEVRLFTAVEGNYIVLNNGTRIELKVPSGAQSGIKLKGPFQLSACARFTLEISFDGDKSIQVHLTGNGGFILRPVVRLASSSSDPLVCSGLPICKPKHGHEKSGRWHHDGDGCSQRHHRDGDGCTGDRHGDDDSRSRHHDGDDCPTNHDDEGGPSEDDDSDQECIPPASPDGGTNGGGAGDGGTGGGGNEETDPPPPSHPGDTCTQPSDCLSGDCQAGTCETGAPGSPCSEGPDCASGVCKSDGTCGGTGTSPPGGCATNSECLSGACVNEVCQPGGQGAPCNTQSDCANFFMCIDHSCQAVLN